MITGNNVTCNNFERGEVIMPACDVIATGICDVRRNDVKHFLWRMFFYFEIEIVNVMDL